MSEINYFVYATVFRLHTLPRVKNSFYVSPTYVSPARVRQLYLYNAYFDLIRNKNVFRQSVRVDFPGRKGSATDNVKNKKISKILYRKKKTIYDKSHAIMDMTVFLNNYQRRFSIRLSTDLSPIVIYILKSRGKQIGTRTGRNDVANKVDFRLSREGNIFFSETMPGNVH